MNLAIITARGGSKRIPRKNIKEFCGKPILAYSIEAAIKSEIFDEVMVSTDDEEIAKIAVQYGAKVPFFRSAKTSDDFSTTAQVLEEVVQSYQAMGKFFDKFCCIYPTAPFVTSQRLKKSVELLSNPEVDAVIPVVQYSFPPQRAFLIDQGKVVKQYPEHYLKRSQDLEPIYHDCGQFYTIKTEKFLQVHSLVTENTVPMIIPETQVQDIDTLEDWLIAENKYKILQVEES